LKKYSTLGCCGIDCGLCPRFHTKGDSACPGCGGLDFKDKHPSCGFLTCCVIKKGLEVCSDCKDYPCSRFDAERQGYDSFVTHRKIFDNIDCIKSIGIEKFIDQQKIRMNILNDLLTDFNDGRSKSFFCICSALLPLNILQQVQQDMISLSDTIGAKTKLLKEHFQTIAQDLGIELKLNHKTK
jgi:hypothetical protein